MKNLRQILAEAEKKKVAVGHFNFADLIGFKAIVEAAEELGVPVILGTSESEAKFIGREQAVALVKSLRDSGKEVFLNSDHTKSLEEVKKAVAVGYDAILFDGAHLDFEENIRQTKAVVEYVKSHNAEILVEGEIGNIGTGSQIRKELPHGAVINPKDLTTPEQAARFVKETGVDLLAPAVGNIHGMFKNAPEPALDSERIRSIRQSGGVPLVLHGGSGNTDEDFVMAIDAGVVIVHISTEIRLAWREGLEKGLKDNPEEIAPYKVEPEAVAEMKHVVKTRLKVFSKL